MPFARSAVHPFVSSKTDSPDSTLLQPSDWNAAHTVSVSGATSGGIPYFSSATSEASSALLAQYGVVLGGGAAAAPYTDTGIVTSGTGASLALVVNHVIAQAATNLNLDAGGGGGITVGVGGGVTTSGSLYIGAGNFFGANGRSLFTSPSDGNMTLTNNDGATIARLKAKYASSDGTAGLASFGPAAPASITVKDGLIVAAS